MKEIDINWLKRLDSVHEKLDRSIPLGSKTSRCTKEILIDRYFKFLENKTFKIRIPLPGHKYRTEEEMEYEVFYAWFNKTKHTITSIDDNRDGEVHYSYGVEKYNGWNDHEFTISFRDEKLKYRKFKLHWNDILRITYEEIPNKEYFNVVELFIVQSNVPGDCNYFDEAQGKNLCGSKKVKSRKCVGVDCGDFEKKIK
jgi:hypothetical protein